MIYVNCPSCGGKLLEGEKGSKVRVKCHKCKKQNIVSIDDGGIKVMPIEGDGKERRTAG